MTVISWRDKMRRRLLQWRRLILVLFLVSEGVSGEKKQCTETEVVDTTKNGKKSGFLSSYSDEFNNYLVNQQCSWRIIIPRGTQLVFQFISLDLEESQDGLCRFDSVSIYESGERDQSKLIARRCAPLESMRTRYKTKSNQSREALVYFRTDNSRQRKGFDLKWVRVRFGDNPDDALGLSQQDVFDQGDVFKESIIEWSPDDVGRAQVNRFVIVRTSTPQSRAGLDDSLKCTWANACYLMIFAAVGFFFSAAIGFVAWRVVVNKRNAQTVVASPDEQHGHHEPARKQPSHSPKETVKLLARSATVHHSNPSRHLALSRQRTAA